MAQTFTKDSKIRTQTRQPMKIRNKLLMGAAAAGAAAAGYYFYASKNAKKNRDVAAKWAVDFKDDVMKQAGQLKHIDRTAIVGIIDGVTRAYEGVRSLDHKDVMRAADELKGNWQKLKAELSVTGRAATKEARKTIKENGEAVRKTAKKVARKVRKAIQ